MGGSVLRAGGRWVRPTYTEWVQEYPDWSRPVHLEMPLLTEDLSALMDYPVSDALAICIPAAWSGLNITSGRARFEGYCKASLFLARQMLHLWDMPEFGVPVFIGVSENGLSIFQEYAQACNFPDANVVVLPSYEHRVHGWHCKFDLLSDDRLQQFCRQLHFDASLWLRPQPSRPAISNLLKLWSEPERQLFATMKPEIRIPYSSMPYRTAVYAMEGEDVYSRLASLCGTTVESEITHWSADVVEYWTGACFGTTSYAWRQPKIVNLLSDLRGILEADESIMTVLARELPITSDNACLGFEDFIGHDNFMPGFHHEQDIAEQWKVLLDWRATLGYSPDSTEGAQEYPSVVPPVKEDF